MLKKAMEPRPRNLRESMELPNGGDQRIHVDSDVVMSPTYAPWLARTVLHMVAEDIRPPLAHVVCDGPPVSWHDFAKAIFETGLDVTGDARFSNALSRLTPKVSDPWPSRPKFSAMENSLPNTSIGTWRSAIEHFFFYEWANISLEESQ
jgi:dTDP-4-dehydrorhamnose reductase